MVRPTGDQIRLIVARIFFFSKVAQSSNSKLLPIRSWWKIWHESSNSKLALVSTYIVYASSWSCLWIASFFSGKQEWKEPFFLKSFHNRPLKSTEVGEEMLESSNSKLFLVTCYIALGCVFFLKISYKRNIYICGIFLEKSQKTLYHVCKFLKLLVDCVILFFRQTRVKRALFLTIVHLNQRKLVKKCLNLLIRSCFGLHVISQ